MRKVMYNQWLMTILLIGTSLSIRRHLRWLRVHSSQRTATIVSTGFLRPATRVLSFEAGNPSINTSHYTML
ncbi:uncharacterized protein BCR38DRAFT_421132 [Pseudomassariella vexata]|uniref:Uncharacterized protein n=1 Tax=Pseudomassariella vexata TaxID=1141098 RepID=A0A1Y2EF04_9PEZI|nr:uncharacterized protein BCR38DRAFT_421132 [Pseudomassariella vexata]ORY70151.1 hypothetical protein BCR38DRAFT_421132 [Pseudomassariella vexata]